VRLVLGEELEGDLAAYVNQLRRVRGLLSVVEGLIAAGVGKAIAASFGES